MQHAAVLPRSMLSAMQHAVLTLRIFLCPRSQCRAMTKAGQACTNKAKENGYCGLHLPLAEQRTKECVHKRKSNTCHCCALKAVCSLAPFSCCASCSAQANKLHTPRELNFHRHARSDVCRFRPNTETKCRGAQMALRTSWPEFLEAPPIRDFCWYPC